MTYEKWMYLVDNLLQIKLGLYSEDLTDFNWKEYWEDGISHNEAVDDFIEEYYTD